MKIQDFEDYKKNLEHLKTPSNEEFSKLFPFKPYTIQLDFMSNLYEIIIYNIQFYIYIYIYNLNLKIKK